MNVLVISPFFYGFNDTIVKSLEDLNYNVVLFNEYPDFKLSIFNSIFMKLPGILYRFIFDFYIKYFLSKCNNIDVVFIIRGESFTKENMRCLRQSYPCARFIMYQWDKSINLPLLKEQLPFFNAVYSFDPSDCRDLNLKFLPLFYQSSFLPKSKKIIKNRSIFFYGTDNSDRYKILSLIKNINCLENSDFVFYLYRSRLSYYFNKYIMRDVNLPSYRVFESKPISQEEIYRKADNVKVILDLSPQSQVGLSSRVFEALAMNKKLITTNRNIINYDFFTEEQIFILDYKSPIIPDEFYYTDYKTPKVFYENYSAKYFLEQIL